MDTLGTPSAAAEAPPAIRPNTGFSDADYVRGMERLLRAVQDLSLARSLAEVQRIVRTAARELTGCDGATFVLRDDDTCFYADEDAIAPLWKGNRFPMNIGSTDVVVGHFRPGSAGQRPPRVSMAMAMSASGLWNP